MMKVKYFKLVVGLEAFIDVSLIIVGLAVFFLSDNRVVGAVIFGVGLLSLVTMMYFVQSGAIRPYDGNAKNGVRS